MYFNHVAIHIRDVCKKFSAVGAAMRGGGVAVQVCLVVEAGCATSAVLGRADNKQCGGAVGVDVSLMAGEVGFVGERPCAYIAGVPGRGGDVAGA